MDYVTDGGGSDVGGDVAILRYFGVGAGIWSGVGIGLGAVLLLLSCRLVELCGHHIVAAV